MITPDDKRARATLLRDQFLLESWDDQGPGTSSKVGKLEDVIRDAVAPGQSLYFGGSLARPNAALFSVARALWGTDPRLTIITPAFGNQYAPLVLGGLVAKGVTSMHATVYPAPAPNPVFVQAEAEGSIQFEDWSLLSLMQRLMAGAFGVPFWPTKSLLDSDLERDLTNAGLFSRMASPFGHETIGVVPSLSPDVCFIHGLMADEAGNVVIPPPWYDDIWAAKATSGRVIVTVEKIVDTETIKRYSSFVRLPGHVVTDVCLVPMGGHPTQVPSHGFPEVAGYQDDYVYLQELRDACRSPELLAAWTEKWILGVTDQEQYLALLGSTRLKSLRAAIDPDSWKLEMSETTERLGDDPTEGELLACLGGRALADLIEVDGITAGLAGAGAATLSAWIAERLLRRKGIAFDLVAEAGAIGMKPRPLDPFLFSTRNHEFASSLSDLVTTLGTTIGGAHARAVAVLGGGQVDRHGNINSTRVNGKLLTGSGGGNDAASAAHAVVISVPHRASRLVDAIEFITSPGRGVKIVVTDRGLLTRESPNADFKLAAVLQREGLTKAELIDRAMSLCGWALEAHEHVELLPEITDEEIQLVRSFDPHGNFVG